MKILEKVYNNFLKFFGDIKVYKYPMFILYDPGSYKIKGDEIRQVINIIEPGDILIRGYVNYLDGYFIPGFFSHAGLYIGKVSEKEKSLLKPEQYSFFKTGDQLVIHSMAEGVFMEDIINFCRCDYMVILRRNEKIKTENSKNYTYEKVLNKAMQNLGKEYDFKFDFNDFHKLSCTEFVYDCCKGFLDDYGIKVKNKRVLLMNKRMITPDDFINSKLDIIWKSTSVSDETINKIRKNKL